eukprot:scaffold177482_cov18-Tisochrysis_lutea.AAC.4
MGCTDDEKRRERDSCIDASGRRAALLEGAMTSTIKHPNVSVHYALLVCECFCACVGRRNALLEGTVASTIKHPNMSVHYALLACLSVCVHVLDSVLLCWKAQWHPPSSIPIRLFTVYCC